MELRTGCQASSGDQGTPHFFANPSLPAPSIESLGVALASHGTIFWANHFGCPAFVSSRLSPQVAGFQVVNFGQMPGASIHQGGLENLCLVTIQYYARRNGETLPMLSMLASIFRRSYSGCVLRGCFDKSWSFLSQLRGLMYWNGLFQRCCCYSIQSAPQSGLFCLVVTVGVCQ